MALLSDTSRIGRLTCVSRRFMLAIVTVMVAGCGQSVSLPPRNGQQIAAVCPTPADPDYYLPASSINPARDDKFLRGSFSSYFRNAGFTPLWCGAGEVETYRLLYVPSSRSALLVEVRAAARDWLNRRRWNLNLVRFEDPRSKSSGPSDPVKIIERQNRLLSDSDTNEFLAALDRAAFWDAPPWQDAGVDDGTMIVIEARAGGVYRSVTRWSTDARVFGAAVSLIQAANVPVPTELDDQVIRLQRSEDLKR